MTYAPDLIEKMARAYRNFEHPGMRPLWDDMPDKWKVHYRYCAKHLLTALGNQGLTVTEEKEQ
jgi:hypothetical protein